MFSLNCAVQHLKSLKAFRIVSIHFDIVLQVEELGGFFLFLIFFPIVKNFFSNWISGLCIPFLTEKSSVGEILLAVWMTERMFFFVSFEHNCSWFLHHYQFLAAVSETVDTRNLNFFLWLKNQNPHGNMSLCAACPKLMCCSLQVKWYFISAWLIRLVTHRVTMTICSFRWLILSTNVITDYFKEV